MQQLETGDRNVTTASKDRRKVDAKFNTDFEKENINNKQKLDREKEFSNTDEVKPSQIMKTDSNTAELDCAVVASSREDVSTKTSLKPKRISNILPSMSPLEGYQKRSTKKLGAQGVSNLAVSETKTRLAKKRVAAKKQASKKP